MSTNAKRKENDMKTVQLAFTEGGRPYSYLCEDDSIKVGDMVEIEARDGGTKELTVLAVRDGTDPKATKFASRVEEDA